MEIGGFALGLREGVIALIAAVAFYMVFVLLRMRRLRSKAVSELSPSLPGEKTEQPVAAQNGGLACDQSREVLPSGMAEELMIQGLERELAQMRDEVDAMRGELAALRQDMLQELAHFRASQTVSPIYGDAMQMAVAGYDPVMIAERCGIARAEAELVVALAKSQER